MEIPTHTVIGFFKNNHGRMVRTTKLKFAGGDQQTARDLIVKLFRKEPLKMEIAALKAKKKSVKLNIQHDYMTLTADFPEGTFRLTTSRRGAKITGDFHRDVRVSKILKAAFDSIPAKFMSLLEGTAKSATTAEEFLNTASLIPVQKS